MANCLVRNITWFMKNEKTAIKAGAIVSGIILAGLLIGLAKYGINLASVFFGPPEGAHEPSRGILAIEGALVALTLLFGGTLLASIIILLKARPEQPPPAKKEGE